MTMLPEADRRLGIKIAKFIAFAAVDFLLPDTLSKPIALVWNFYRTFLCTDPRDLLQIYAEAQQVTPERQEQVLSVLVEELESLLPEGRIPEAELRHFCENLLASLRDAAAANQRGDSGAEQLRRSLNLKFFQGQECIQPEKPSPRQKNVGRLRVSTILHGSPRKAHASAMDLPHLPQLPDYDLLQVVGAGGFAQVYKAIHRPTGTLRALKIGDLLEPERFQREIQVVAQLQSPHVVKYHEHGEFTENGRRRFWIAMEYLGEQTLADLMQSPKFREYPLQILQIVEEMLRGLSDLHRGGILHRDIKPANVMFDSEHRVKLIDLGLLKPLERSDLMSTQSTGTLRGTPFYMSPEQLRGLKNLTPATDIYSLGLVVCELFTGANPNQGPSLADVILKACTKTPDVNDEKVPPELREWLSSCVQLDPSQRPASALTALSTWHQRAAEVTARVNFERDRASWHVIMDREILTSYLKECVEPGQAANPTDFMERLRQHQISVIDEQRLTTLFDRLRQPLETSRAARQDLQKAKEEGARKAAGWNAGQFAAHARLLQQMEERVEKTWQDLMSVIRDELALEIRTFEEAKERERRRREQEEQQRQARRLRLLKGVAQISVVTVVLLLVSILLWRWISSLPERTFRQSGPITSVAFRPDGQTILTGSDDIKRERATVD